MKGKNSKQRAVALVLTALMITSSMSNPDIVWGDDLEDGDSITYVYEGGISIADDTIIGKIEEDTAYIKGGQFLGLDCSNCDWTKTQSILVINENGVSSNIIYGPGILSVPMEDGNYSVVVNFVDGTYQELNLRDVTGFNSLSHDTENVFVSSLLVGERQIEEGCWVAEEDCTMKIVPNIPASRVVTISVNLNGSTLIPEMSEEGIFVIDSDSVKGCLARDNSISIQMKNDYGTEVIYSTGFMYDDSVFAIDGLTISETPVYTGSTMLIKRGAEVNAEVIGAVTDISNIEIKRDGVTVASSFPFILDEEGFYEVFVKTQSGKTATLQLFDDYNVVFDVESPTVVSSSFNGEEFTSVDWFNTNGVLEIKVRDDKGLSDNAEVVINGTRYPITYVTSEEKDGIPVERIYSLNTNAISQVESGNYSVYFSVSDLVGNPLKYNASLHIDIAKPSYEGIIVSNLIEEDGVQYVPDVLILDGGFTDLASGIKSVGFKSVSSEEYVDVSFPYSVYEDGTFRVEDNAGNLQEYSLEELLTLLGVSSYIVDTDTPMIEIEMPAGVFTKEEVDYYKSMPTIKYTVSDSNLKSVDFYVNNVKVDTAYKGDGVYEFTPEGVTDGKINVKVIARDKVNRYSLNEVSFVVDSNSPTDVSASAPTPINQKGGKVYFNDSFTVEITASDNTSGIKEYRLNDMVSVDGKFTISSDGTYFVTVVDNLGNTTVASSLSSLMGWVGDDVVIDKEAPKISASRPAGESSKANWFGDDVIYNIAVTDNKGIDSAYVEINGVRVDTFSTNDLDVKNISLKADTSKVNPNADGSYNISVYSIDNGKLSTQWSDRIYIDKTNPSITGFIVSGEVNTSNNGYKFFFNGRGSVQVNAKDSGTSSGIYSIWTKLDGKEWVETKTNGDSVAYIDIPEDYKGVIQAYVVDNVGHASEVSVTDPLLSEGSNTHLIHSKIAISFDNSNNYDENNLPLFGGTARGTVFVNCDWAGLKQLEWGIDDKSYGVITDFSGASAWDRNLPLSFTTDMLVDGNSNSMNLWVRVTDNANHTSENSRQFSIDKDKPEVKVTYDKTVDNGYYNTKRVAKITVKERNFDSSKFVIEGNAGTLGNWVYEDGLWSNTMTFDSDGDYDFLIKCSDRAGNTSDVYNSGFFVIDMSAPVISVSWDNNDVNNGKYFSKSRTATITVIDRNFDSSLLTIVGAEFGEWSHSGSVHTSKIVFSKNGEYNFSISGKDKCGNVTPVGYSSGDFVIDTSSPDAVIEGVSDGVSYKSDLNLSVKVSDTYIDESNTSVTLYGKNHKPIEVKPSYNNNTITFDFGSFAKEEYVDDVYTLVVKAVDMAGSSVEKEISFSVNRFGSKYSFLEDGILGNYLSAPRTVTISEMNVDRIDVSKVKIIVTLDGKEIDIPKSAINIVEEEKDGKYLYTYTIDKSQFSKDGKYTVQVFSVVDDGTEYTSVAEQYDFIVDTTKPNIIVSGISDGERYQGYELPVTVDVRDISGVKSIKVYVNDKEVETEYKDGMYCFSISEGTDTQKLRVEVIDNAGNSDFVEIDGFIISSNVWLYLWNQLWFKILLCLVGVGIVFLIVALILRKRRDTNEEERLAKENEAYLLSSSSSGSQKNVESDTNIAEDLSSSEDTNLFENSDDDTPTDLLE